MIFVPAVPQKPSEEFRGNTKLYVLCQHPPASSYAKLSTQATSQHAPPGMPTNISPTRPSLPYSQSLIVSLSGQRRAPALDAAICRQCVRASASLSHADDASTVGAEHLERGGACARQVGRQTGSRMLDWLDCPRRTAAGMQCWAQSSTVAQRLHCQAQRIAGRAHAAGSLESRMLSMPLEKPSHICRPTQQMVSRVLAVSCSTAQQPPGHSILSHT